MHSVYIAAMYTVAAIYTVAAMYTVSAMYTCVYTMYTAEVVTCHLPCVH